MRTMIIVLSLVMAQCAAMAGADEPKAEQAEKSAKALLQWAARLYRAGDVTSALAAQYSADKLMKKALAEAAEPAEVQVPRVEGTIPVAADKDRSIHRDLERRIALLEERLQRDEDEEVEEAGEVEVEVEVEIDDEPADERRSEQGISPKAREMIERLENAIGELDELTEEHERLAQAVIPVISDEARGRAERLKYQAMRDVIELRENGHYEDAGEIDLLARLLRSRLSVFEREPPSDFDRARAKSESDEDKDVDDHRDHHRARRRHDRRDGDREHERPDHVHGGPHHQRPDNDEAKDGDGHRDHHPDRHRHGRSDGDRPHARPRHGLDRPHHPGPDDGERHARRWPPHHPPGPPPHGPHELGERMMHLHAAVMHLHAAGLHEPAERIERMADEMRRESELTRAIEEGRRAHGGRPPLGPGRPQEMDELRREVRELHERLDHLDAEVQLLRAQKVSALHEQVDRQKAEILLLKERRER